MAKSSALGWTKCDLDNAGGSVVAIVNDVTDLQFATPRGVYDWTGIDKSAYERGLGLADYTGSLKGVWNPTVSHPVLASVTNTAVERTLTLIVGGQTLDADVLFTEYSVSRSTSGEMAWNAPYQLATGIVPAWTS